MDIEKLIEQLSARGLGNGTSLGYHSGLLDDAATALSTLQAENERLKSLLGESGQDLWSKENQRADRLEAENERLRAELEQVISERDAAVSWAQKYTESIDRPCVACKHNTGDYVCTAICGNCGPMGTESCKWEFDFSGELKED